MEVRRPEAGEPLGGVLLVPSVSLAEPSQFCSPGFLPSSPPNCWMLLGPASHPYSALALPSFRMLSISVVQPRSFLWTPNQYVFNYVEVTFT